MVPFDPSFAAPADWAAFYRACGLQIVPSHLPHETQNWKRPKLADWKSLQEAIVPQPTWDRWYGLAGEHVTRTNMGLITGRASGNIVVIDLDEVKKPTAVQWWQGVLALHNSRIEPETWQQITGSGGRHLLFRAPPDYVIPTCKTPIGVDIRGQGGFAVLPPSMHVSGLTYQWRPGFAPWEIDIADAEPWLLEAIDDLVHRHEIEAGQKSQHPFSKPNGPTQVTKPVQSGSVTNTGVVVDAFGAVVDGRETYMRDLIWAAVVGWRRECPIKPTEAESAVRADEVYQIYELAVKSRAPGPIGTALEQEHRGTTLFREKWRAAMAQWDADVTDAAREPRQDKRFPEFPNWSVPPFQSGTIRGTITIHGVDFVIGFRPPAYLADGIIQRSYLYAFTARTGHGKTAIGLLLAACVARGKPFHGRKTKQGSVLFLAGENPDDIRARYLVLADHEGFDIATTPIYFVDGIINLAASMIKIREEAEKIPDLCLIIVDTAAAYFLGDDSNSNAQQGAYARLLRQLTTLPGKPAVVANCHPVKNAAEDNLLPLGGSAFVNEVDGNLVLWMSADNQTTLHWQGKIRGPEFEPFTFELKRAESEKVKDAEGRLMPSVVAVPIAETTLQRTEEAQEGVENRVMNIMADYPGISVFRIGLLAGITNEIGQPVKVKVHRLLKHLAQDKLVYKHRGGKYRLTSKGLREIGRRQQQDTDEEA